MVENGLVAGIHRRMISTGTGITEQDHITGADIFFHPGEAILFHVIQVEFPAAPPPVIRPFKVRKIDASQMISIAEQAVTIRCAVMKYPSQQMRHRLKPADSVITDQQPRQTTVHLHSPICRTQIRLSAGMAVNHRDHLTLFTGADKIITTNRKIVSRFRRPVLIRKIVLTLLITDNQAAGFPWRIREGVRQNSINHKCLWLTQAGC